MLANLTLVDYVFLLIIVLSTLMSLLRGFVKEALSLATWGIAVWATFAFVDRVNDWISPYITNAALSMGVSIMALFLVVLALGMTVSYIITKLVSKSDLSGTDRIIGIFFGAGRGVLLVTLAMLGGALTPLAQTQAWETSVIIPRLEPVANWISDNIPDYMNNQGSQALTDSKDKSNDTVDDYSSDDYSDYDDYS